jgi:CrcB protein
VTGDDAGADPLVGRELDPDVDLHDPAQVRELSDYGWRVLAVIAVGGVIGGELRYGTGVLLPPGSRSFPWVTLLVNVVGGFGIGALMAAIGRARRPYPLIRPLLGVGVLGGFTTFSTYSTDTYRLIDAGRPELALGYAALTLIGALAATLAGRAVVSARPWPPSRPAGSEPSPEPSPRPSSELSTEVSGGGSGC